MRQLIPEQLENLGYRLQASHRGGPLGTRCLLEPLEGGIRRLADLVFVSDCELLRSCCNNARSFRGIGNHSLIVQQLNAGWLRDDVYFQILDLAPEAETIGDTWPHCPLDAEQLWAVASHIVAGLLHLQERRAVHGAIAPSTIYLEHNKVRISEFWWSHDLDEMPHSVSLRPHTRDMWPKTLLPFLAPEVLAGASPAPESDIYGLGATLFFVLTGMSHRQLGLPSGSDYSDSGSDEYKDALLNAPVISLASLRPDLDDVTTGLIDYMLDDNRASRPELSQVDRTIKAWCNRPSPVRIQPYIWEDEQAASTNDENRAGTNARARISSVLCTGQVDVIDAGNLASILDAWSDGANVVVTIRHPVRASIANYQVVSVFKASSGEFAVVTPEKSIPSRPERTLVKIVSPQTLQALKPAEFAKAMLELPPDVGRGNTIVPTEAEQFFGKLPERFAPPEDTRPQGNGRLTNRLRIGGLSIAPETSLSVVERWKQYDNHLLVISTDAKDGESEFLVRWFVSVKQGQYAILMYPPGVANDSIDPPWILVRVVDESSLATVSCEELETLLQVCESRMDRFASGYTPGIDLALGPFISAP